MGAANLARERFAEFIGEALPLMERHKRELSPYPDVPLGVAIERYCALDDAGILRVYTARIDGKLVGYSVFFVQRHLHYESLLVGVQDVLWIAPEHRGGFLGARFVKFIDAQLAIEGVQVSVQHVKLKHPDLGRLLVMYGYEASETVYLKRLDLCARLGRGEDQEKRIAPAEHLLEEVS